MTVAALFIDPRGHYPGMPDVECWDEAKDARGYEGPHPVVAHPPCQLWVNMAAVNWKRYGRQPPAWYPEGSDGGLFRTALRCVAKFGGVLEHPADTHAWSSHGIRKPHGVGWEQDGNAIAGDVWVCEVWQSAYGHLARKRTWLLYCGKRPPFELRWERNPGTHQVGWFDRIKPTLSKAEAIRTPQSFADELVRLAKHAAG